MIMNTSDQAAKLDQFMQGLIKRNPGQPEFYQAVFEFAEDVLPYMEGKPEYENMQILERMTEPDRVIIFRVCWEADDGTVRVNRGHRVQFSNAIGPYKGGLRFHPSVNLGILKFLGFEQVFKNSLTTLPLGGAKGGANFNPKGKSDREVMRFCQSFMTELHKYIGPDTDIPAGDIGVGAREIGYMFGHYKRLQNEFVGAITGKGLEYGGSLIRPEATGYGCVFFVENMLNVRKDSVKGKICAVSGSGNVAQYTIEKLLQLGAKVVTASDSDGFVYDKAGFTQEKLEHLKNLKNVSRGRISDYAAKYKCEYHAGKRPWGVKVDLAFPSATQNEIELDDAKLLIKNGVIAIGEGANMPTTHEATKAFLTAKVLFAPAKAANAGGVAVSGLEMTQNSIRVSWTRDELEAKLKEIMARIHAQCVTYGKEDDGYVNYVRGANIAGFKKVADAMLAYGVV
jgi:glutamate dehydrogenase (NADP+)